MDDFFQWPSSTPSSTNINFVTWYPPQPRVVKINFDGSCVNSTAAEGFILWAWTGKVLKVGAANYQWTSSLVVEAHVLKDGVSLAVQARYLMISIKGDTLVVIQALKVAIKVSWQITNILEDVNACLTQEIRVSINHTF